MCGGGSGVDAATAPFPVPRAYVKKCQRAEDGQPQLDGPDGPFAPKVFFLQATIFEHILQAQEHKLMSCDMTSRRKSVTALLHEQWRKGLPSFGFGGQLFSALN